MAKRNFAGKLGESLVNTAVLGPRAVLATTTCIGQLLRNFLATDVNGGKSLKYKESIKNWSKKITYTLAAPVTAWNQKRKQKRTKLDTVPGPKERNKDMVRYDYMGRTNGRIAKYTPQVAIDAGLLGSEGAESLLYLDKESPMYTGPWPTITQKIKNFGKSLIMPFEPIFRWSQNKLGLFGGKKKSEAKKEEKPVEAKKEEKPIEAKKEEKPVEVKKEKPIEAKKPDTEAKPSKPASTPIEKPKSIADVKKNDKEEAEQKEKKEIDEKFPQWSTLDPTFKKKYKKDYIERLKGNPTKEGVIKRGKEANLGEKPEEIVENFKKIDPTFAGYMEEEILKKAA